MNSFSAKTLFLALGLSTGLGITSCDNGKKGTSNTTENSNNPGQGARIAYVNIDSLQEKYGYWKTETEALASEQAKLEAEIQSAAQKLQNDYMALQQKAQSGTLSEAEGRATQQRLAQAQQQLENRRATLSEQFQNKQVAFSERLQKNIDEYLEIFNKDKKYDFILSYSKAGQILHANKALDITEEVLKGLNEFKPSTVDSTKK